jgi:ribosomal protein S6--L-glutamate ligase
MHILILSRKATIYSTRRLVEAGLGRGHEVTVVDPLEISLVLTRGTPSLYLPRHRDQPLRPGHPPHRGRASRQYGLAVVRQFDMMGIPVLNNAVAIARSRDKLRAMQLLTRQATSTFPPRSARRPAATSRPPSPSSAAPPRWSSCTRAPRASA